jgi:membrane protein implicated in regulation of membrane protease activity
MSERRPRRLKWGLPESPPPKHPYRDTLLVYGVFAVIIVLLAWATGGGVGRAIVIAAIFYLVASCWSIYRWRERLQEARRSDGEGPA